MKKLLAILMAVMMLMTLTCALAEEEIDWSYAAWDAKTVKYQFTGEWSLAEYDIYNHFLLNLYEDGTAFCAQQQENGTCYCYCGNWSEEMTEDGNEITLNILVVNGGEGFGVIGHAYDYTLYEEDDGAYAFGFTFGLAPGQYFRDVDMDGSSELVYESLEAFTAAVVTAPAE